MSTDLLTTVTCGAALTVDAPSAFAGASLRTGTVVVGVVATGSGTAVGGAGVVGAGVVGGVVSTGAVVGGTSTPVPPAPAALAGPVYNKRFAVPTGSVTTFGVALIDNAEATAAGVNAGVASSKSAAAPATCGVAIDVPDNVRRVVGEEVPAETIAEPGAKISTHEP